MTVRSGLVSDFRPIPGVRVGVARAGLYASDRDDIAVFEVAPGAACAAVFTRNAFCAAPVTVARAHLTASAPRYLLVNAGNANAGTGERGLSDALACCAALARLGSVKAGEVIPYSTGVIGEPLPVDRICSAIPDALTGLADDHWQKAARAIMTTDTVPKGISEQGQIDGEPFTITGICKGSGMICPDMATMLAFLATDVSIDPGVLRRCLVVAVDQSFNRITVDGDTSTNDACTLVATGKSNARLNASDREGEGVFTAALVRVCESLAEALIHDAEGATKFITVEVKDGRDDAECLSVAYAIAHSPLVKTAFFASDPNWGRILAVVGRAGLAELDVGKVEIWLDEVRIVRGGERDPGYSEAAGQRVMSREKITVSIRLGRGGHAAKVLTSDLSDDYVRINADYRS